MSKKMCKETVIGMDSSSGHKLFPENHDGPVHCSRHPDNVISLNCVRCDKMICKVCRKNRHKKHKCESIEEAIEGMLPKFRKILGEMKKSVETHKEKVFQLEDLTERIKVNTTRTMKKVTSSKKEKKKLLENDFNNLEKEVRSNEETSLDYISNLKERLYGNLTTLEDLVKWGGALQENTTPCPALLRQLKHCLAEDLQWLVSDDRDLEACGQCLRKDWPKQIFVATDFTYLENTIGTINMKSKSRIDVNSDGTVEANEYSSQESATPDKQSIHETEKSSAETVQSFRCFNVATILSVSKKKQLTLHLQRNCNRICYHNNQLWLPCFPDNCIDIFTSECELVRTIQCEGSIKHPRCLHPVNSSQMLVGAESGLFAIDMSTGQVIRTIMDKEIRDVHVCNDIIAVLDKDAGGNCIHFFDTNKYNKLKLIIDLGHTSGLRVLLVDEMLYVSSWSHHVGITWFSLKGKILAKWGKWGRKSPGELCYPLLCSLDPKSDALLISDGNSQLQMLSHAESGAWEIQSDSRLQSHDRKWYIVPGIKVEYPWDVVVTGDTMWVLFGDYNDYNLRKYQLSGQ